MKQLIAIQDANILIDLVNTGLFDYCLSLEYQFVTVDIIFDELHDQQEALIQPHINSGKFNIIKTDEQALVEIQIAAVENRQLSEQDFSALYYAQQLNALLLTGDKRLRNLAKQKGVPVCGALWILDKLVDTSTLTKKEAGAFLKQLIIKNKRLPAEECNERLKLWCGE